MKTLNSAQRHWLSALTCERLSADTADPNHPRCRKFRNTRIPRIQWFINRDAVCDVDSHSKAVYVVRAGEVIVAYIAIRCGQIHERHFSRDEERAASIFTRVNSNGNARPVGGGARKWLEHYKKECGKNDDDVCRRAGIIGYHKEDLKENKKKDKRINESINVKQMRKVHPAIEIAYLGRNEDYTDKAFFELFPHERIGQVVFLSHFAPLIESIAQAIGCEHVYLFAASKEGCSDLVRYYETYLGFTRSGSFGVVKSVAEAGCKFMWQTLDDLIARARPYML